MYRSTGYYMYIEVSDSSAPGSKAHLASPFITPSNSPRCMEFYFHMWGVNIDMLNVYLVAFGDSLPVDPHVTLFGDRGNQWLSAVVDILPEFSKTYRVILRNPIKALFNLLVFGSSLF